MIVSHSMLQTKLKAKKGSSDNENILYRVLHSLKLLSQINGSDFAGTPYRIGKLHITKSKRLVQTLQSMFDNFSYSF